MLTIGQDIIKRSVIFEVFHDLKITPFSLTGPRRDREASRIRALVCAILRARHGWTLSMCADAVDREESSVARVMLTHDLFVKTYFDRQSKGDSNE